MGIIINGFIKPETELFTYERSDYKLGGKYGVSYKMINDNYFAKGDDTYRVYVLPQASHDILCFIQWGEHTQRNTVEQGGVLVGHNYYDDDKKIKIGLVKRAIPAVHAKGSAGYLNIRQEDWKEIYQKLDQINAEEGNSNPMIVLGWFHTHPNMLSVFMSGTDRETQRNFFASETSVALVFNPQRRRWKSFRSLECDNMKAEPLLDQKLLDKLGRERVCQEDFLKGE